MSNLETMDDFKLVHKLLGKPRYEIPNRLRDKVIRSIENTVDFNDDDRTKIAAIKVLADLDKINLELVKIAMPKKIEHFDPSKVNDDELLAAVKAIAAKSQNILEGEFSEANGTTR